MELTQQQYEQVAGLLPRRRGNVKVDNRTVLTAILYVVEQGCKWRGLPERFGKRKSLCGNPDTGRVPAYGWIVCECCGSDRPDR